jgi:uroporphyrinogen-III decarboxylase
VPVIPQICHPHAIRALGLDFRKTIIEAVENPFLVNRLDLDCCRSYGVDGMRIWIPADPVETLDDGESVWQVDKKGQKTGRVDFMGGGGIVPLQEKPALESEEDIENIGVLSADELLRTDKFQSIRQIVDEAREELFLITPPGAFTFEYVTFMRGKEQALMDLKERPEFAARMIDKATEVAIQHAIALASMGIDGLYIGDTFGGLIGPALFHEFCVPAVKRFVAALKPHGVLIYLHICGNSTQLFELMADTGVDCIEPLDPLGGVVVADAKRRVGHRVALMGGVNTVALAHGPLDEVIEDCKRCIGEGAPGGGYILAAGDMLPTETSREKVEAMIHTAKTYGQYPLTHVA